MREVRCRGRYAGWDGFSRPLFSGPLCGLLLAGLFSATVTAQQPPRARFIPDSASVRTDSVEIWGRIVADRANSDSVSSFMIETPTPGVRVSGLESKKRWRVWPSYRDEINCVCIVMFEGLIKPGASSPRMKITGFGMPGLVRTWTEGDPSLRRGIEEDSLPYSPFDVMSTGVTMGIQSLPLPADDTAMLARFEEQRALACAPDLGIPPALCTDLAKSWRFVRSEYARAGKKAARVAIGFFKVRLEKARAAPIAYWTLRAASDYIGRFW